MSNIRLRIRECLWHFPLFIITMPLILVGAVAQMAFIQLRFGWDKMEEEMDEDMKIIKTIERD